MSKKRILAASIFLLCAPCIIATDAHNEPPLLEPIPKLTEKTPSSFEMLQDHVDTAIGITCAHGKNTLKSVRSACRNDTYLPLKVGLLFIVSNSMYSASHETFCPEHTNRLWPITCLINHIED